MIEELHKDLSDMTGPYGYRQQTPDFTEMNGCLKSIAAWIIFIVVFTIFVLLTSCSSMRGVTVVEVRDSVRTDVSTRTVVVVDTQYVTLPPQIIERETLDTVSTIVTKYATSTASVSGGVLRHNLRINETPIPVTVHHTETSRDSVVYREKEVPVPVPVQVEVEKPLTSWQQARIWLGNAVLVAFGVLSALWALKRRLSLFRKLKKLI